MDTHTKLFKNSGTLTRIIDANAIVIFVNDNDDSLNKDVYIFNDTGTRVWELINAGSTVEEIVKKLCFEYEIASEEAIKYVKKFTENLAEKKLINS